MQAAVDERGAALGVGGVEGFAAEERKSTTIVETITAQCVVGALEVAVVKSCVSCSDKRAKV